MHTLCSAQPRPRRRGPQVMRVCLSVCLPATDWLSSGWTFHGLPATDWLSSRQTFHFHKGSPARRATRVLVRSPNPYSRPNLSCPGLSQLGFAQGIVWSCGCGVPWHDTQRFEQQHLEVVIAPKHWRAAVHLKAGTMWVQDLTTDLETNTLISGARAPQLRERGGDCTRPRQPTSCVVDP